MMKAWFPLAVSIAVCQAYPGQNIQNCVEDANHKCHECFPGEALVEGSAAVATYESTLGFLHSLQGSASFLAIEHDGGVFRASGNHLAFRGDGRAMAVELFTPGDELLLPSGLRSRILSITKDATKHGMFAPLTASGTITVDGVTASNYATVGGLHIPHSAMHASFMLSRLFSAFQTTDSSTATETMNPLAHVFHRVLKLDKLL